ncbi:hypothetical protein [Caulobacter segnis]|uniref:hypothetical protein n=1 Tax=Caulobacter segnis TaxID=88688 RepID=UPI001CC17F2F|nr:hypothetical protein [Caulobacter segnis]UAL11685.1 hypothetical protein K8940_05210 [Caulobacter segnis]
MQVRLAFAVAIYLGSYLPLSIILLAQNVDYAQLSQPLCLNLSLNECKIPLKNPLLSFSAIAICLLGIITSLISLAIIKPSKRISIISSKHIASDLMNYVLPYVVSFMGLNYAEPDKMVGFIVFLAWIFLITYKSGQIMMNPVLSVFGWRLYEIEYSYMGGHDRVHTGFCLAQDAPEPGETLKHNAIQDVLIIKRVPDAPST